jgi:hypothetical protein
MRYYFAQVDLDEADYEVDSLFLFQGVYYWHMLEVTEDQVTLWDTCGRNIPMDFSALDGLLNSVSAVSSLVQTHNSLCDAFEEALFRVHSVMESFGNVAVEDDTFE